MSPRGGLLLLDQCPASRYREQRCTRGQYLTLPVLSRKQVGKFFALAGPQVSLLIGAYGRNIHWEDATTYDLVAPPSESWQGTEK